MALLGTGFKNCGVAPYAMNVKNCPDVLKSMNSSSVANDQANAVEVLRVKQLSLSLWNDDI